MYRNSSLDSFWSSTKTKMFDRLPCWNLKIQLWPTAKVGLSALHCDCQRTHTTTAPANSSVTLPSHLNPQDVLIYQRDFYATTSLVISEWVNCQRCRLKITYPTCLSFCKLYPSDEPSLIFTGGQKKIWPRFLTPISSPPRFEMEQFKT